MGLQNNAFAVSDYNPYSSTSILGTQASMPFTANEQTEGAKIRYRIGTAGVDVAVDCTSKCAGEPACTECTSGSAACQFSVAAGQRVTAIACKAGMPPSKVRHVDVSRTQCLRTCD